MPRLFARTMLSSLAAAWLLGGAPLAQAATEATGFHATVYLQASRLGSTSLAATGVAGLGPALQASFDLGRGFGGDIGYRYGNGWSAEVEWNYRRHGLKSLHGGLGNADHRGDFASNTLFINGLRRFPGAAGTRTPYVGAGLGWVQEIDLDVVADGQERGFSKSGKPALQLIGGVVWPLGPGWSLTTDLRWLRVGGVALSAEEGPAGRISAPRYNPLSVQVGLRRSF